MDLNHRAAKALRALHEQGRIESPWLTGMQYILGSGGVARILTRSQLSANGPAPWGIGEVPDLSHRLAAGALLSLLREARGEPDVYTAPLYLDDDETGEVLATRWRIYSLAAHQRGEHPLLASSQPTEVEALVAALEAVAGERAG